MPTGSYAHDVSVRLCCSPPYSLHTSPSGLRVKILLSTLHTVVGCAYGVALELAISDHLTLPKLPSPTTQHQLQRKVNKSYFPRTSSPPHPLLLIFFPILHPCYQEIRAIPQAVKLPHLPLTKCAWLKWCCSSRHAEV